MSSCDASYSPDKTASCRHCGKRLNPIGVPSHEKFCGPGPSRSLDKFVQKGGPDECWPWMGSRKPRGYGHMTFRGRDVIAHRIAWEVHSGRKIPEGMHVLHSCDNPPCCNPAHLSLGDHDSNMADKARKGRGVIRLTEEKVREIREKKKRGVRSVDLQSEYGVSQSAIYEVINRRSWRWVA